MFICKQVVVFFVLQNTLLTSCEPLPVFSGNSEYMNNDELLDYSKDYDITLEKNIFIAKPEVINPKKNYYEYEIWNNFENRHLEYSYEDYVEDNINEHSESSYEDYFEDNTNEHSENSYEDYFEDNTNEHSANSYEDYDEENTNEHLENNSNESSENNFNNFCQGEDSAISHSDIKYLIEDRAETLKIKENVVNSYYYNTEEVFEKYIDELEEFQKRFKERPGHMRHVLQSLSSLRDELEPKVEELAAQLEQFETLEDNFNVVAKDSVVTLNRLEKYKNICNIYCEEIGPRFGHEDISGSEPGSTVTKPTGMYCIRLKHLTDYINDKLNEVEAQYNGGLSQPLDIRDELYKQKIMELKSNLKDSAVKQFGMTMYELLSLHDDYHHFTIDLEHVNVSSEIHNIMENIAEIDFKLIGLKRDLEKYRQHCMKCGNPRIKRHVFKEEEEQLYVATEKPEASEIGTDLRVDAAIDELIQSKIDEIKESIEISFITMFAELDKKLDDPDIIDQYVRELHPIQEEIEKDIKNEQETLFRLRSCIPETSINQILDLSKESKEMVQKLESAKKFINQSI